MKGNTVAQRERRAQRDMKNNASRNARRAVMGLDRIPLGLLPAVLIIRATDWADSPRKRDRRVRPGGKLTAGTSMAVRHARRDARIKASR